MKRVLPQLAPPTDHGIDDPTIGAPRQLTLPRSAKGPSSHGTAEMDSPSLSAYSGALAEHNFSPLAERPPPAPVVDAEPAKPGADFHTEQIASRPL